MPADDIFQQTAVNIQNGEPCAQVFYLKVISDAGTLDPEQDAAHALRDQVLTKMAEFMSNQVEWECILSRRVDPTTTPARVIPIGIAGDLGGQELPANVAFSVRHYSENGDNNRRGRWFINGMLESWVVNGRLSEAHATAFDPFITSVTDFIVDNTRVYRVQHFSKKLGQHLDIDSALPNPVPTKLRGRTPGLCSIS